MIFLIRDANHNDDMALAIAIDNKASLNKCLPDLCRYRFKVSTVRTNTWQYTLSLQAQEQFCFIEKAIDWETGDLSYNLTSVSPKNVTFTGP